MGEGWRRLDKAGERGRLPEKDEQGQIGQLKSAEAGEGQRMPEKDS